MSSYWEMEEGRVWVRIAESRDADMLVQLTGNQKDLQCESPKFCPSQHKLGQPCTRLGPFLVLILY